ncbi:MAG: hypothetical protein RLZZ592_1902, partial [Pseudomonadota bacterium]
MNAVWTMLRRAGAGANSPGQDSDLAAVAQRL